jgi:hypothetical protein
MQPPHYYADGAGFARALDKDLADKSRLLGTLGTLN